MFTLIIGASACGKSEYAERHVLTLGGNPVYIATMEPFGDEARARIRKHQHARAERGFQTIERYVNLSAADLPTDANVLLEDLGNLTANELYRPDGGGGEAVLEGIQSLLRQSRHLTVVTNDVFSGGQDYQGDTLRYLHILAELNRALAERADRVVEVVCGLPNVLKEGPGCGCYRP